VRNVAIDLSVCTSVPSIGVVHEARRQSQTMAPFYWVNPKGTAGLIARQMKSLLG
jgi:hypothetical protein